MNAAIPRQAVFVQINAGRRDSRGRRGNARRRRSRGSSHRGRRGSGNGRRNWRGGNGQRGGGHPEGRGRSKPHVGKCGAGGTLSENGIQFCRVGIKRRGAVAAKRDGRLELAVVFDKGSNLRVERRASITGSDRRLVRVGVNFCNSVTAAARPGTSLARVSQNKTRRPLRVVLAKGLQGRR